jgi:hypothetical protein
MAQNVDSLMDYGYLRTFRSIITDAMAALGRGLKHTPVGDGGGGVRIAAMAETQDVAQIIENALKHIGLERGAKLLIDRRPGRKIVGEHPPGVVPGRAN